MTYERRIDRMAGCSRLGKGILAVGALALAVLCLLNLNQCFFITDRGSDQTRVKGIMRDFRAALEAYEIDYNHFPIPETTSTSSDMSTRSRDPMLSALVGLESAGLNPRKIRFIELSPAKGCKNGLWRDGAEWVFSDLWGEPYYIVLDTNKDGMVANPEYGADQSDPDYAKRCKISPPPATAPLRTLIYSSGPDRDPKTWQDNICSWR